MCDPRPGETWCLDDTHSKHGLRCRILSVVDGWVSYVYVLAGVYSETNRKRIDDFKRIYRAD